jgi:transketolase
MGILSGAAELVCDLGVKHAFKGTPANISELEKKAFEIRLRGLEMALRAGKGHVPPAFSWAEIGVALYYGGVLRWKKGEPHWAARDRFLLSKGHACLTLYAMLADLGFIAPSELDDFAGDGSLLAGHPDHLIPGVEAISGSLGHALGLGAGIALGMRMDEHDRNVFVLLGDGECHEGSIWEAAMFAGHHKLRNLIAIVDRNNLGATDFIRNTLALDPFEERWRSFGWDVHSIDGHSIAQLLATFEPIRFGVNVMPIAVIANTIKGKGVDFMENSPNWHHQLPKGQQIDSALRQLRARIAEFAS